MYQMSISINEYKYKYNCSNIIHQITPSDVQAEKYMPAYKISKNRAPKIFGGKGLDFRLVPSPFQTQYAGEKSFKRVSCSTNAKS